MKKKSNKTYKNTRTLIVHISNMEITFTAVQTLPIIISLQILSQMFITITNK